MVDLDILKRRGITHDSLKKRLSPDFEDDKDITEEDKGKLRNFRNRVRQRIMNGRDNNIANHKVYYALDLAWNTPFRQISPTLLQSLMEKNPDEKTITSTLAAWGFNMNDVTTEAKDPKTGLPIKRVNIPAFFAFFVPIVKAYVTMRWARIMEDRALVPFLKYEPHIDTAVNRLRGQAMTSRAEQMTQQYGLFNVVKQAVFQMLHYSEALLFPMEEWHVEMQESEEKVATKKDEDERNVVIVREGIRYQAPHPSRTYKDEAYRLSTLNTDTGVNFAGYWRVVRYLDVRSNKKWWATDKISIGATDWWTSPSTLTFFNTMYGSCVMSGPPTGSPDPEDRETKMANQVYSPAMDDQPVLFTEHFEKVVPSEAGLGDYDYPVWFRFVVSQWDHFLYAAALPYTGGISFAYDADENRSQNASMSLECLPAQDHFNHLMTQFILSTKQNLANAVFVDTDVVGKEWIDTLRNWGEKLWRVINFIPFSGRKAMKSQHGVPQAFFAQKFQLQDTEALIRAMNIVLDTLERTLAMSDQEIGQAASHEQTREEVKIIQGSTSTRLSFTSRAVDQGIDAMKRQIYEGLMAYGHEDFWAQVPSDHLLDREQMTKLGFTVDEENATKGDKRVGVKVKKTAIGYVSFTSRRDGLDRINNTEGGVAMLNFLMQLVASPLAPVVGSKQILELINLSCQLIGFPREFKLDVNEEGDQQQQQAQQQQQMQAILEQVAQVVMPEVQKGLVPIMDEQKRVAVDVQKLGQALGQAQQAMQASVEQLGEFHQEDAQGIAQLVKNQKELQVALANIMMTAQNIAPQTPPTNDFTATGGA